MAELERRRVGVADEANRLGALDSALTDELAASRRALREFAVEACIDGGQSDLLRASLSVEQAQALSWQASLSGGAAMDAEQALLRFDELKDAADPDRVRVAAELDGLDAELRQAARFDAIQASAFERDAEAALARAEQAAADAAAEQAAAEQAASERAASERAAADRGGRSAGPDRRPPWFGACAPVDAGTGLDGLETAPPATAAPAPPPAPAPAPPATNGAPTAAESATLAKIRRCESGGNYSIVSGSGRYAVAPVRRLDLAQHRWVR